MMITIFKIFETWNDNKIDSSLFVSGRAKHNPKVRKDKIEYKTDNGKFVARIEQISDEKFLCKVYKVKDGSKIRIKKKYKKTLKTAHNFIREILNDRLEGKGEKRKKKDNDENPLDKLFIDMEEPQKDDFDDKSSFDIQPPKKKKKTIIRRFVL